jgi:hypothetical protein
MAKKSGRTPIGKPSETRPSEPLIREKNNWLCMERRTMPDHSMAESHYQSLIAEPLMVDGEPGVMIDVASMDNRLAYYMTMEEVKRLSDWLTRWSKEPTIQTVPFGRNLRRNLSGDVPANWLRDEPPADETPKPKRQRKRGGPSNG